MATVVHSPAAAPMLELVAFRTALGWISMAGNDSVLYRLSFGHRSRDDAVRALERSSMHFSRGTWKTPLAERLQAYAEGEFDDSLTCTLTPVI